MEDEVSGAFASAREREDYEVSVIIGTNTDRNDCENRSFKRSVELEKVTNTVHGECNNPRCNHINDLTMNKSVYCEMCGMLITNRYY